MRQYQQIYQTVRDNLLQKQDVQEQDQYGLAVYATWSLSYNKLDPSARSLLQICSMLHHEGITEETFKKGAFKLSEERLEGVDLEDEVTQLLNQLGKQDSQWNSLVFQGGMGQLVSYSLINFDRQNDFYSIHPLVQHWTRTVIHKNQRILQGYVLDGCRDNCTPRSSIG